MFCFVLINANCEHAAAFIYDFKLEVSKSFFYSKNKKHTQLIFSSWLDFNTTTPKWN